MSTYFTQKYMRKFIKPIEVKTTIKNDYNTITKASYTQHISPKSHIVLNYLVA